MSNFSPSFDSFYVSDLDGYVSLDAINASNAAEREEEHLSEQFEGLGEVELLAGETVSGADLRGRSVSFDDWNWEVHRAEGRLRSHWGSHDIETVLVKDLIELGKHYAIGRYAKLERISVEAAKAAALPFGIQALLHQFFLSAGLRPDAAAKKRLAEAFRALAKRADITAYEKTGSIRAELHVLARNAWGSRGEMELDRSQMRKMLSLVRLHFLVMEPKGHGFRGIGDLDNLYRVRREATSGQPYTPMPGRQFVPNWSVPHHFPLHYYYPIDIRNALDRGVRHALGRLPGMPHRAAVNELALATCAMPLIKVAARTRPSRAKSERSGGGFTLSM